MLYKRLISAINIALFIAAVFMAVILCGCKSTVEDKVRTVPEIDGSKFSAHILDVGQGDCILINFPTALMVIDSGSKNEENANYIVDCITATGKDKIDYLVITHPDEDHVGNIEQLTKSFSVGTAYLPHITDKSKFPYYEEAYNSLLDNSDEIVVSELGRREEGEDWFFQFLWPLPVNMGGYIDVNAGEPTSSQINDVSAVIYLDYRGIRFLFTGDCGKLATDKIIEYYNAGIYNIASNGRELNLNCIDFLKVSHHGSKEGINKDFYQLLSSKNAGISVGAGNNYGHPATETLTTLKEISNCNIYRTDLNSTISISESEGEIFIKTAV